MPVVVGAARSGTTLLRLMLDAHPELSIPPETHFIPALGALQGTGTAGREELGGRLYTSDAWSDFGLSRADLEAALASVEPFTVADGIRAFYRLYAARHGKPRWGDKTPNYCLHLGEVAAMLPEAHFVHVIRDGRDVAASVRGLRILASDDIGYVARDWAHRVTTARALGRRVGHYLEVRYEDLVTDTTAQLRRIAGFVGLAYDPAMERYHEHAAERMGELRRRVNPFTAEIVFSREERLHNHRLTSSPPDARRIGRWRDALAAGEQSEFEAVAGALLVELGYETGLPGGAGARAVTE